MKRKSLALVAPALLTAAFAFPASAADVVSAVKIAKPPVLAAGAADPAWAKAKALSVPLAGGMHFKNGNTTATIKAVYSGDMFYMLVQYDDPTESVRRFPYQKQSDGSWKKLTDPKDQGGDDNVYYEDKFALIWNIGNSIKGFGQQGCMVACHAGEPGKPYGNKDRASEGERGDIWHMKAIRTGYIGQVDDQYLDHTRYDKDKSPEAGRKSDPKTGGGYTDIKLVNGKPEFMHKSAIAANKKGGTYYLKDEDKAPFDDGKFKAGDEVICTSYDMAMSHDGGYAGMVRVPADWVVPLPQSLTLFDAMAIGTAGYTSALAIHLLEHNGMAPGNGKVVVNGATGGCASLAIDMLAQLGYSVTAITGKTAEHDYLKRIGASEVLGREVLTAATRPLEKALWAAAFDSVGGEQLAALTRTVQPHGVIASFGNAGGIELHTTVLPFILRGVSLIGVDSAYTPMAIRRKVWQRLAADLRPRHLKDIAQTVTLDQLPEAFEKMLKQQSRGRIVVRTGQS